MKIFLWKACHDWLPTRVNIAKRKVPVDGMCQICLSDFETTSYALCGCSFLKFVCHQFGVLKGKKWDKTLGFLDFFYFYVNALNQDEFVLLYIIWWCLWFLRNNYAHDGGRHELGTVVEWCERYLVEYGNAIGVVVVCDSVQVLEPARWVGPMVGMYKLNTDAAIGGLHPCVGVGMVIRDNMGNVMASSA
ncbi:hypothetical protein LWI28_027871 [Acer negundo]|uniref:Reverse transcriptase zinc-binding domain-containing protein n=1 Tax=Acer negundo TaxID=4023 RepID=A0AAD5P0I4_ACENE|nr:hypothetical protein LWI28_027871 [Acer negundo]